MFPSHFVQGVPHNRLFSLDHFLGGPDGMHLTEFFQTANDKRFKQDQSHLLRQAALVELEFGTDDDDGTSRVVDSFAQKVHPETSGLPLQHVGQGF